MSVVSALDDIFERLAALGRPVAQRKRNGLSSTIVAKRFSDVGLHCHPDVVAAYAASDGTDSCAGDTIGDLSLFPGYYWLPLHEVFEVYEAISSHATWSQDWVPLFASGGGDFYAVVCSDKEIAFGSMVGYLIGEPDIYIEFPTLGAMIETVRRSYHEGAFFASQEGLEADYGAMRRIAVEVSPTFLPFAAGA